MLPNGGLTNFSSLVIQGLGFDRFGTLLIGMPSSIVSSGSMVVWGLFSIKYGHLRTWGMIIPLLPAIADIAIVYGTMNTDANKYGRVVAYWLINSYAVTWPFLLTIIGQNVAGHTKRAFTNALMLIIFAAGNIAGPFFFRTQDAPHYVLAITTIPVCFSLALFCALGLRLYMIWENRRRERVFGLLQTVNDQVDGMRLEYVEFNNWVSSAVDRKWRSPLELVVYPSGVLPRHCLVDNQNMPKSKRKIVAKSKAPTRSKALPGIQGPSTLDPVFFYKPDTSGEYGFLSPWWYSRFTVKDEVYINAGQFILAEKARAFGDKASKARQRILEESETEVLISLGENIKGLEKSWRRRATRIAQNANIHKFLSDDTESRDLLRQLKNLGERELVFADPSDAVLGIGLSATEATEVDRAQWGANVSGKSIEAIRATKACKDQKASDHRGFDTSIFDVGGRLSIHW
ncbi:hypothetical protein P171DRAFT_519071 [Karstenula rhodostoma CBS 690.94]|uniref:NADAR domain-containing protein n=1 Tax=Karstenula rhodostoma CBS 690.94 TaxID=1392251 RepID=A0A9P4PKD7_9PLEO|nr:hypothetical protein P171DRAFT_519071 [Karstenula rhodostoma CBS 690.94]